MSQWKCFQTRLNDSGDLKMLKLYNNNNDDCNRKILIKKAHVCEWKSRMTRLTYTQTDKDRQTNTCTSINTHCCTQTPENIIIKDWLPVDFFVASVVLYHIPAWVCSSSKSQSYSLSSINNTKCISHNNQYHDTEMYCVVVDHINLL